MYAPDPAIDVDISRPEALGDRLIGILNGLRQSDPLYWSEHQGAWIVTGHQQVLEGFRGHLPLSAQRQRILASFVPDAEERARTIPYIMEMTPHLLTNTDPPEQLRLRRLMMKAFSKQVAEANRPFARQVVGEILDAAAAKGEVDFMEEVARQLPARVILRLMGLSEEYLPRMRAWANAVIAGLAGSRPTLETLEATEQALVEMRDIFRGEIDKRRRAPGEDFLSYLVHARDDDDTLSEDEMIATCHLTLIAGHDTTANTIALSVAALSKDAAARDFIRDNPDQILPATMELMRHVSMSTSMARIVSEDFTWHGRELKAGQFVYLMIAAANRDPAVFSDPDRIDMSRPQDMNMTFAPGLHFCIGHLMAKMQLSEFLPAFLERFDAFELIEPELTFGGGMSFRGPVRLPMRLHARTPLAA